MLYKVEMQYIYGWDDAKWTEEENDQTKPLRFPTNTLAQAAIDELIADVKAAAAIGNMSSGEIREDYRVVEANDIILT